MHRFFVSPNSIQGQQVIFDASIAHQLAKVLRMQHGQQIIVLDNRGMEYRVELETVENKHANGRILSTSNASGEPALNITLYACLLKKDHFEWVLQKCTEVGVCAFVPVISERTIVDKMSPNKIERWQRIITEAAEQSRRGRIPDLHPPMDFRQAVQNHACDAALIPWEDETQTPLYNHQFAPIQSLALFIGAEGGFSASEIEFAQQQGIIPVSLGSRILRAETASIVASALALNLWEKQNP